MAEPVDAAVALVARRGLAARRRRSGRPHADDLRAELHDQPVPEAGRAAGVVRPRQVVAEPREGQVHEARVAAADRVHQDVAVVVEEAADAVGIAVDPRQLARGVVRVDDEPESLVAETRPVARRPTGEAVAEAERPRLADVAAVAEARPVRAARWGTVAPAIRWVAARSGTGPDEVGMITVM